MITVARDIYGERIRAEACFDEEHGHVVLGIRHRLGAASRMHRADAVSLLRAMLRELAGPSIDDVREVWGVADSPWRVECTRRPMAARHARIEWRVLVKVTGSELYEYWSATEREALQAAYDAGVAQKGVAA